MTLEIAKPCLFPFIFLVKKLCRNTLFVFLELPRYALTPDSEALLSAVFEIMFVPIGGQRFCFDKWCMERPSREQACSSSFSLLCNGCLEVVLAPRSFHQ